MFCLVCRHFRGTLDVVGIYRCVRIKIDHFVINCFYLAGIIKIVQVPEVFAASRISHFLRRVFPVLNYSYVNV